VQRHANLIAARLLCTDASIHGLQVLATSMEQLQQLVDTLLGLGVTAEQAQEMVWHFPGLPECKCLPIFEDILCLPAVLWCCRLQVLATSTEQLQQLVDTLIGLGLTAEQAQEMVWEFPGLLE
jgi:polyhydroxyalkanoate synthesis regulator phasin